MPLPIASAGLSSPGAGIGANHDNREKQAGREYCAAEFARSPRTRTDRDVQKRGFHAKMVHKCPQKTQQQQFCEQLSQHGQESGERFLEGETCTEKV